jgi:HlyD family secretion protein
LSRSERSQHFLSGERGSLVSGIAASKGRITETELQILQIDQDMRTEVGKDLAEIRWAI